MNDLPYHYKPQRPVTITGEVEFTVDMLDTMVMQFGHCSVDGVMTVEISEEGLWLVLPNGGRQFLGRARLPRLT